MPSKTLSRILAAFIIVGLVSGCERPTSPIILSGGQAAEGQLTAEIDQFMSNFVDQDRFSGSLLVARDGIVLISKGYGNANPELHVANTPDTKFLVGSITKQFTAMAILLLQHQGLLDVQDPICSYIRDCPDTWHPITIHHLLTHTSGIPDFTASTGYQEFKKLSVSPMEILARFRDLPLDFTPGERWTYSNSGYMVLGYIIEAVSGRPYAAFLEDSIFVPLEMSHTGYDDNGLVAPDTATGYSAAGVNADYVDMSVPYSAGGLYSTVQDLFLWDQALYEDTLIPFTLLDEMFTPHVPIPVDRAPQAELGYGYGWRIGSQFDRLWIAHGGGIDGFASKLDRYPLDRITIIVLSNLENAPVNDIALTIAGMLLEE